MFFVLCLRHYINAHTHTLPVHKTCTHFMHVCTDRPYRAPAGRTELHHRPWGNRTDSPPPSLTGADETLQKLSGGPETDLKHKRDHVHELTTTCYYPPSKLLWFYLFHWHVITICNKDCSESSINWTRGWSNASHSLLNLKHKLTYLNSHIKLIWHQSDISPNCIIWTKNGDIFKCQSVHQFKVSGKKASIWNTLG